MNPIRPLARVVVDQIAAGEVVERPASVVKELLENALDAAAERIEVRLEEGGCRRIEVRDDGEGIPAEELPLALASHATSKLRGAEGLEAIATLGFRGEALASIAAVSRFELLSRPRAAPAAAALEVRFGRVGEVHAASGAPGTRVRVADLFAELPARLKFLKRPSTELAHCSAWVERLALAHPGIGFHLVHEGRSLLRFAPEDDLEERCAGIYGAGVARAMVPVEEDLGLLRLEARVGPPESARRDARRVHLFLNGRWVRDARLLRAVREGVREFVPVGHYPTLFLALAVPPERVDVNVHPQKTEVRFRDERLVFGGIVRSLRRALSSSRWATRSVGPIGATTATPSPTPSPPVRQAFLEPYQDKHAGDQVSENGKKSPGTPCRFLAVGRTFLVREVEGGMEILDQHALHERVNLEELRREVRKGRVVSQPLLVPALVDVERVEMDLLLDKAELFRSLGVELEAFGETTVALRGVPARLTRLRPEQLVQDLLEIAREQREEAPDAILEETLHRMACRGAVMAGDYLDEEALGDLLRRGAALPQDRTCAHGRPIRVFLSMEDLERAFYRR